jgi:spermidine synthase
MTRLRSLLFSVFVYAAFFASGAGSLVAEVTWSRMLIVVVGNSLSATALIIVVFMGGLGLGSYLGGRVFGSRRASLVPYVLLELAVGLYVLASPALFDAWAYLFTSLAESVHHQSGLTAARLVVTIASLLVPATLMGATFPAMISGAAPADASTGAARAGYLYSINTLGAAIGSFFAGVYLLLEFGVRTALAFAVGCYVAAILSAIAARALVRRGADDAEAAEHSAPALPSPTAPVNYSRRFLGVATFGIGFAALAYEVLLTRLVILYVGNVLYVFPLVLTAFLLGTGLSAVLGTRIYGALRTRAGSVERLFAWTALASAAAIVATPYLLLSNWVFQAPDLVSLSTRANPLPVVALIVAPTLLIGSLLPIAIRLLDPGQAGEATRGASTLYALNTLGGLLGAGLVNYRLVPLIGIQGTLVVLASICAAVGFVSLLSPGRGTRRWLATAGCLGALAVLLTAGLPKLSDLYAHRMAIGTRARAAEVKLIQEGRAANVTVIDEPDPTRGMYRDMYLNGVEEASTRFPHVQLFKLLGMLPVMVHPSDQPKDVLVIAFGAGMTAGSTLASDQVASLDVVDLNPDIEGINNLFADVNGDVFHQPRFHFHNDDGRNYLVTSNKHYDVIASDSTHPRAYDSWILYTAEFYRSVKERLRPGGIFAQWVPVTGSMQGDLFRIHLNTFRSVFPHSTLWYVYGSDQAFFIATPEPFALDAARLQAQLDRLPAWFKHREYQIDTVARLSGFFWLDEGALAKLIGDETRINTDNAHYIGSQLAAIPSDTHRRLPFFQASIAPYLKNASPAVLASAADEQAMARRVAMYGFFGNMNELYRAYCARPDSKNVQFFLSWELAGAPPKVEEACREQAIGDYRALLAQHPDNPEALNALADLLGEAGRLDEALLLAEKALRLKKDSGMVLDTYGWILRKQKKTAKAIETLDKAAALLPNQPIVLYHLGAAHRDAGDGKRARELVAKALSISSDFPGAEDARLLARE